MTKHVSPLILSLLLAGGWLASHPAAGQTPESVREAPAPAARVEARAPTASSGSTSAPASVPRLNVVEHTLKNGMKFLIVERRVSPTVAAFIRFKVGGVDDPAGQTGIAHLLEHMMFKGTTTFGTTNFAAERPLLEKVNRLNLELQTIEYKAKTSPFYKPDMARVARLKKEIAATLEQEKRYIIKAELDEAYSRLGGNGLNAFTGSDNTTYVVELPSNALEAWAYVEADRVRDPVFREFYAERDVVHEERRMRTETQPAGLLHETLQAITYTAHPYRNPIVGWPTDIDNTKNDEVMAYFRTYYAPNNAIAAVVGDVDAREVIRLAEKYFGTIPAKPQPFRTLTVEPEQQGERRAEVVFDANPQLAMSYHIPALGHPDAPALEMLGMLLSEGRTSRLYRAITQKGLGTASADGGTGPQPNVFGVNGVPRHPTTTAELERAILAEFERLKTEPVSERELQRLRNQLDADTVRSLESNNGIAMRLLEYQANAGDWRYFYKELELLKAVTAADLMRVARKYLTPENRTVVALVRPGASSSGSGEPAADANRPASGADESSAEGSRASAGGE
jgi:predicted Zn-dependent peptidase